MSERSVHFYLKCEQRTHICTIQLESIHCSFKVVVFSFPVRSHSKLSRRFGNRINFELGQSVCVYVCLSIDCCLLSLNNSIRCNCNRISDNLPTAKQKGYTFQTRKKRQTPESTTKNQIIFNIVCVCVCASPGFGWILFEFIIISKRSRTVHARTHTI